MNRQYKHLFAFGLALTCLAPPLAALIPEAGASGRGDSSFSFNSSTRSSNNSSDSRSSDSRSSDHSSDSRSSDHSSDSTSDRYSSDSRSSDGSSDSRSSDHSSDSQSSRTSSEQSSGPESSPSSYPASRPPDCYRRRAAPGEVPTYPNGDILICNQRQPTMIAPPTMGGAPMGAPPTNSVGSSSNGDNSAFSASSGSAMGPRKLVVPMQTRDEAAKWLASGGRLPQSAMLRSAMQRYRTLHPAKDRRPQSDREVVERMLSRLERGQR